MTDEQIESFLEKFDEADVDKSGTLGLTEFKVLFADILPGQDDEAAELYFNGIDVDGNKVVSKGEFQAFAKAALTKDTTYTLKLVFRAFDKNRNGSLEAAEIKQIGRYVGKELEDQEVQDGIAKLAPGKTGLNFAQVVKLLTDADIAGDTDPYDGKLKKPDAGATPAGAKDSAQAGANPEKGKKSGCCLLL
jgi:Ca2+-binding EF-hand superfamily protein